jgi:pantetheine-phosphate adenylyltransferase
VRENALMKNIAVYAGTFDPITYGHMDVIERACRIFDQVIIAVAINASKKPLFNLEERVTLIRHVFSSCSSLMVEGFDSLLIDFAKKHQANVILRGLRAVADFDYEFQLASMNRCMNASIESVFLFPSEKHMYISSSLVREIAAMGGDVSSFVAPEVLQALYRKVGRSS